MNLNWLLDKIERPTRSGVEGALMALTILFGFLSMHNSASDLYCEIVPWKCRVTEAKIEPEKNWRDLGPIYMPQRKMLPQSRIKNDDAQNGDGAKQISLPAQKQTKLVAGNAGFVTMNNFVMWNTISATAVNDFQVCPQGMVCMGQWTTASATTTTAPNIATMSQMPGMRKAGGKTGRVCRITCFGCHEQDDRGASVEKAQWDVETDDAHCAKARLDSQEPFVYGWIQSFADPATGTLWEERRPWPGPAEGLGSRYRLYWKEPK